MPEIDEFLKLVDFDVPFRDFVGNVIAVPKVLSDLWEAICGAVLMDGGWQAVLTTFG
jgi:dsRNA-specific ribonuclease